MGTLNLGNGASFTGGSGGFLSDAPSGTVIKSGSYYTGSGSGASTTSSSNTPYTININGTGQKLFNLTNTFFKYVVSVLPDSKSVGVWTQTKTISVFLSIDDS